MVSNGEPDRLMTAQEVADYLQIPINTLYKNRSEGKGVPAAKIGKHLRYRRSDVEAYVEAHMDDWVER